MQIVNVLSLFDGMSCGQLALDRIKLKYENYFASEIDKYAIKITQYNYPNTIQLGDIKHIKGKKLLNINLLLGGSPCKGFSFAGKGLNFNDPESALFFEFVRLLKECSPKFFLLENVPMKKEFQDIISKFLNTTPISINSSLVSAQNRIRLYWTNIIGISQPLDKHIHLKNITEDGSNQIVASRGRYLINGKHQDHKQSVARLTKQRLEYRKDNKSNTLTTVQKDNLLVTKTNNTIRPLTPLECERLQTVPDNYTSTVSKTQRLKMLGNGWTIDIVAHILKGIPNNDLP